MAVEDVLIPNPSPLRKERAQGILVSGMAASGVETAPRVLSPRNLSHSLRPLRVNSRTLDIVVCGGAYLYGSLPLVYALA
ncbi:MAG: hypothetical protein ACRDHP_03410, partial [Ktedonobacterales bacterium]